MIVFYLIIEMLVNFQLVNHLQSLVIGIKLTRQDRQEKIYSVMSKQKDNFLRT